MQNKIALITILTMTACAPRHHTGGPSAAPTAAAMAGILGSWDAKSSSYFNRDRDVLEVFDRAVIVTKICRSWGRSTTVNLTAPAIVSGSRIEITAPARALSGPGELPCEVKLDAGPMVYQIDGNVLTLSPVTGPSFVYARRGGYASSRWSTSSNSNARAARDDDSASNYWAQRRAYASFVNLFDSKTAASSSTSRGGTYRATSRPSTMTLTKSFGTGVVRSSGRSSRR